MRETIRSRRRERPDPDSRVAADNVAVWSMAALAPTALGIRCRYQAADSGRSASSGYIPGLCGGAHWTPEFARSYFDDGEQVCEEAGRLG